MTEGPIRPGEFDLIARYFAPLAAGEPGALGLLDDAAVLELEPGQRLVVTTDAVVAGVHFPENATAADVAAKLLRVNLSDLAAMGALPRAYTLTAALPADIDESWVARFADRLYQEQETFGIHLVGGDTVSTPGPLTLTATLFGTVGELGPLTRSGARAGDTVYASGTIGDAALGLLALAGELKGLGPDELRFLDDRLRHPSPRVELGQRLLSAQLASAAVDVSDGLIADLGHICEASGLGAEVWFDKVPLSPAAAAAFGPNPEALAAVLGGGDDYELLFTATPQAGPQLGVLAQELDIALTPIGRLTEAPEDGRRVRILGADGAEVLLDRTGFRHF